MSLAHVPEFARALAARFLKMEKRTPLSPEGRAMQPQFHVLAHDASMRDLIALFLAGEVSGDEAMRRFAMEGIWLRHEAAPRDSKAREGVATLVLNLLTVPSRVYEVGQPVMLGEVVRGGERAVGRVYWAWKEGGVYKVQVRMDDWSFQAMGASVEQGGRLVLI